MLIFTENSVLKKFHSFSDQTHSLVSNPNQAEIILILAADNIIESSLIDNHRRKSFVISTSHLPYFTAHGVYTTASGRLPRLGSRVRSGAYNLVSEKFKNPFIEAAKCGIGLKSEKKYLFSFIGRNCHQVRNAILETNYLRNDILVEDSSSFNLWQDQPFSGAGAKSGKRFFEVLKQSKFGLCPRGVSPNSIRLFECMKLGIPPIIVSDGWLPPKGPNWSSFSIFVHSKDLGKLEFLVESHENDHAVMGEQAKQAYLNYFSDDAYFNFLVDSCQDIMNHQWLSENVSDVGIRFAMKASDSIKALRKNLKMGTRLRNLVRRGSLLLICLSSAFGP